MTYTEGLPWGWCRECERVRRSSDDLDLICSSCGESMVASGKMTQAQREAEKFSKWADDVMERGLWGPSPGGAAGELKCSRAHIDMLVAAGVLERVTYDAGGHFMIMISQRSIEGAKQNKRQTGSWAPRGREREQG
ncbi:MAG: hypothetical protein KF745_10695 [Phycisphaeraceae bacterium]|nr:hypothetical protein [Phycisphaeraceae bacterium]